MDQHTCDAINFATQCVASDLLALGAAFMVVPTKGPDKDKLAVCCDRWCQAIQGYLKQEGIQVSRQSFASRIHPCISSKAYIGLQKGRFENIPKAAFLFNQSRVPLSGDALIQLLQTQPDGIMHEAAPAPANPGPSTAEPASAAETGTTAAAGLTPTAAVSEAPPPAAFQAVAAAAEPLAAGYAGPSAAAQPPTATGFGPSAVAGEPSIAGGPTAGTRVLIYLPDGSALKQTTERMYVAAAIKEFLGDITIHTLSSLSNLPLRLQGINCDNCNVRVDIMGCEHEDPEKVYCTGCASADKARGKLVTSDWIRNAGLFMAAMNPDSCSSTLELGFQRPALQGPYFPGSVKYWNESTFMAQLGEEEGKVAWSNLKGRTYQDINLDCKEDCGIFAFVKEMRKHEWGLKIASSLYDMARTTIILIGSRGTGTGFHLDWARAANWAILIMKEERATKEEIVAALSKAVALWAFCHPDKVQELQTYIQRNWSLGPFRGARLVKLNRKQLEQAQQHLGCDGAGRPYLELKKQFSGDVMHVVPGWPHMVLNLQPCLKVAWEYLRPDELSLYVKLWRQVAVPYFKGPRDYVGIQSFLMDAVRCTLE